MGPQAARKVVIELSGLMRLKQRVGEEMLVGGVAFGAFVSTVFLFRFGSFLSLLTSNTV